jgi:hypothetical protein
MKNAIESEPTKFPLRHGKLGTIFDVHHNIVPIIIVPIISGRHVDADKFAKNAVTTEGGF